MADTKAIITATTPAGATVQKTLTGINPYIGNAQLASLGSALNSFTDNTYGKTEKVTKVNCDAESGGGKTKVTLEPIYHLENNTTDIYPLTDGATINLDKNSYYYIEFNYNGDSPMFFYCSTYQATNGIEKSASSVYTHGFWVYGNNETFTANYGFVFKETDNYRGAAFSFTVNFT